MELDPGFVPARLALGQAYVQKQMFPEAIRELEKAVDLSGGSPVYLASLAHAYGVTGRKRDTARVIDQLQNLAGQRYVASFDMALAWLGLGDRERTLASLETSVEDRSPRLLFLSVEPRFDPLRSNARFQAFETSWPGQLLEHVRYYAGINRCQPCTSTLVTWILDR